MLKNDRLKDKDRKKETENLLGPLAEERFALLTNLGKKITDFQTWKPSGGAGGGGGDDIVHAYGINLQFEESEEEDDEDVYGEVKEDEDDDMDGEEAKDSPAIQAQNVSLSIRCPYWSDCAQ